MRIFSISPSGVTETDTLPTQLPAQGFVWLACARGEFEAMHAQIQATLQALTGSTLVDLHISDLLNHQLPSRFDYTSLYDLLVFRRLTSTQGESAPAPAGEPPPCTSAARHWAATCPSAAPKPTSSSPCPHWKLSRPFWSPRPKGARSAPRKPMCAS